MCLGTTEGNMKIPFFKTLLVAGALLMVCSCGDDSPSKGEDEKKGETQAIVVGQASWVYEIEGKTYLIGVDNTVTDTDGKLVGMADLTNLSNVTIIAMDKTVMAQGIDTGKLEIVQPTVITSTAWVLSADQTYVIYPSTAFDETGTGAGVVTDANGKTIGYFVYNSTTLVGNIVNLDNSEVIVKDVDAGTLKAYVANVKVESSSSSAPAKVSSSSSAPQAKSSSSSAPAKVSSSSSAPQAKSSSSQQSSSYTIKYVNGGKSGSGYATRYWDCCKPHCAWPEHGGSASTCDAKGNKIGDKGASSMCDGGNAGICRGQFPIIVNDTLAFAFAATPGGENNCGKCFDLAFTGKGKYATNLHTKLKGKHLIVMSNNVGYDVAGGQFDVMIPGGGYGIFNGCGSKMGWGDQGSQYGGLLDQCETENNYNSAKYKSCLTAKCEKSFSGDAQAKEGCLFMATWMNAAGNPLLDYKEVECPKELKDRF